MSRRTAYRIVVRLSRARELQKWRARRRLTDPGTRSETAARLQNCILALHILCILSLGPRPTDVFLPARYRPIPATSPRLSIVGFSSLAKENPHAQFSMINHERRGHRRTAVCRNLGT